MVCSSSQPSAVQIMRQHHSTSHHAVQVSVSNMSPRNPTQPLFADQMLPTAATAAKHHQDALLMASNSTARQLLLAALQNRSAPAVEATARALTEEGTRGGGCFLSALKCGLCRTCVLPGEQHWAGLRVAHAEILSRAWVGAILCELLAGAHRCAPEHVNMVAMQQRCSKHQLKSANPLFCRCFLGCLEQ